MTKLGNFLLGNKKTFCCVNYFIAFIDVPTANY